MNTSGNPALIWVEGHGKLWKERAAWTTDDLIRYALSMEFQIFLNSKRPLPEPEPVPTGCPVTARFFRDVDFRRALEFYVEDLRMVSLQIEGRDDPLVECPLFD